MSTDPIRRAIDERQRLLFDRMVDCCQNQSTEDVMGAASNLIVNALRQCAPTRRFAETAFDEIMAKTKGILLDHYDPATGRRRNVFPFTQVIEMNGPLKKVGHQ